MPEPTRFPGPSVTPPGEPFRCWTWPAAQHRSTPGALGVGRRRRRLLRAAVCPRQVGGREHDSPPPA
ncbi:hypothetical protein [Terrabacter carboxydivorans]|uniref:hypothetical protein n=1 Tax=Terrabacter carboxydivorans TaxID=619730 RepID=UPI0031DDB64B